ncbi:MAG: leucine-rich repeat protein [Clostridia bacterium]
MNLFFKICASALSTLAIAIGVAFAIPVTRNFILDSVAPYSDVYKEQEKANKELNKSYLNNLVLLTETRTSLINAEFKAISYKNEVGVLQSNLLTSQNNLSLALNQKTSIQNSLDEANKNLTQMSAELEKLRSDYRNLNIELDTLVGNQSTDAAKIADLNKRIEDITAEISRLDCLVDSLNISITTYETKLAEYEKQIADGNTTIEEYKNEIISLNSQIIELKETIKSLENLNQTLKGDDSYKAIFQQIVGGTVTELKASDLDGITEIRAYAFYNCQNLQRVALPESVETIGSYAFFGCNTLEEFIVTTNLKTINSHAFENCVTLKNFNLSNVNYVGDFAFMGSGISDIYVPATIANWGRCIFQNSYATNVYVSEGVTNIPFGMLHGCGQITSLYLPSTLKSIDVFGVSNYSNSMRIFFAGTIEQYNQITYDASQNTAFANPLEVVYNHPVPTKN